MLGPRSLPSQMRLEQATGLQRSVTARLSADVQTPALVLATWWARLSCVSVFGGGVRCSILL